MESKDVPMNVSMRCDWIYTGPCNLQCMFGDSDIASIVIFYSSCRFILQFSIASVSFRWVPVQTQGLVGQKLLRHSESSSEESEAGLV